MSLPGFILRNALRNRRRFLLTVLSVAVSLFLLTLLQVVLRGLTSPEASEEAARRLVVRHRVSLANMLFARYQPRLEKMPGVVACTRLLWFGGIYQDEKHFFPQFGCDAEKLFKVMVDATVEPAVLERFVSRRSACVVGRKTMERFGWKPGQRITLLGAMWPCNLELEVAGAFAGGVDESALYFHHEYFDELLGDRGFTGLFWIRADAPGSVGGLIERIDGEFANSEAETITESEHAFQLGFVSLLGNVKMLIGSVSMVIAFTLLLVTGGTMSMAIRERGRELAVLKALGFGGGELAALILAEAFGLALLGGALGCAGAWAALQSFDFYKVAGGMFVNFTVTPEIAARSLGMAAMLGLLSALVPVARVARRTVVEGLRTVD
jgi:putative ABC transport system permease protein